MIRHNTIDMRALDDTTGTIFWADSSVGTDVTISDNLLAGAGYTVRLYPITGGMSFKNNLVVDGSWGYGPVNSSCALLAWADNWIVTIDDNYKVTSRNKPLNCAG